MEAKWLFDVSLDQIQVVVHPQSIVHSAVEYDDGAVIAQLGLPDMKLPIQYALVYPERRPMHAPFMDLFAIHQLTFEAPDEQYAAAWDRACAVIHKIEPDVEVHA